MSMSSPTRAALPRRFIGAALSAILLLATAFALPSAARADMLLGPGDTVRLSIHGLPNSELQSTIGMDGLLTFAWPGAVLASGKTLEAVTSEIRLLANGRVYKHYTFEGLLKIIQLDTDDIALDVVRYRPVFVTGDVARPGEVTFSPGITARAAIAVSGGVRNSLLSDLAIADPTQIVRWQNEYDAAALDHATALARIWRVDAEIASQSDPDAPTDDSVVVLPSVFQALIDEQRQLIAAHLRINEEDGKYLIEVREQARNRVTILSRQQANQAELVATDEEEMKRVQDLVSRNLVPATRLEDARRTLVLSRSELLDMETQLAQAGLDVTRSEREIAAQEEDRQAELLELREQFTAVMIAARLRMDVLSQNIAGADSGEGLGTLLSRDNAKVFVFRNENGQVRRASLDLDTALLPGDTLEVQLDKPLELRSGQ